MTALCSSVPPVAVISFSSAPGPCGLGVQRVRWIPQLRLGADQRGRTVWESLHQIRGSVVRVNPAAVFSVDHVEALRQQPRTWRLAPIQYNRPFAIVGANQRSFLGEEPSNGSGPVAPPANQPRIHDVIVVHDNSEWHRVVLPVVGSPPCRREWGKTECCPLPCYGAMILGPWERRMMVIRIRRWTVQVEPTATARIFAGLGERESTVAMSAGAWHRGSSRRRTDAMVCRTNDGGGKQAGSGWCISRAHRPAALSLEQSCGSPCTGSHARGSRCPPPVCAGVCTDGESAQSGAHVLTTNDPWFQDGRDATGQRWWLRRDRGSDRAVASGRWG